MVTRQVFLAWRVTILYNGYVFYFFREGTFKLWL